MSKMRLLLFGKALFALSFLFFFSAFYMQFKEEQSFSDPIRDVLSLPNDDKIIISTVNQGDIEIVVGDILLVKTVLQGICTGTNIRTKEEGTFPFNYINK